MKTTVIAEVGNNWTSLDDCLRSMDEAKKAGATLVKFQALNADRLVNKSRNPKHYAQIKAYEIPRDWYKKLAREDVFFSVFDLDTLKFLEQKIKPKYYKIASPDAVYEKLVGAVTDTGKETFISVGGCTLDEIRGIVKPIQNVLNTTLLHCVMAYPADCMYLGNLRDRINGSRIMNWGISDHSLSLTVPALSVVLGATAVEKHFKLYDMDTPDNNHSLGPEQFGRMVRRIEEAEHHLQTHEQPLEEEKEHLAVARRKGDGKR